MRHLNAWRDGEDVDPESGRSHIAHIAASCNILLDAEHCGTLQDERNRSYWWASVCFASAAACAVWGYVMALNMINGATLAFSVAAIGAFFSGAAHVRVGILSHQQMIREIMWSARYTTNGK
jgi:hypothetical protein